MKLTPNQIKQAVTKFLAYPLPADFHPDSHISFDRQQAQKQLQWPSGTNLLNWQQATDLIQHIFQDLDQNQDTNNTDSQVALTYGEALQALKHGHRVARASWLGKNVWLGLVEGCEYYPTKGKATAYALGCTKLPWIGIKTSNAELAPWTPTNSDQLAEDWYIITKFTD